MTVPAIAGSGLHSVMCIALFTGAHLTEDTHHSVNAENRTDVDINFF